MVLTLLCASGAGPPGVSLHHDGHREHGRPPLLPDAPSPAEAAVPPAG